MIRIAICCDWTEFSSRVKEMLEEYYGREVSVIIYRDLQELEEDYEIGNERNIADILLMDIDKDGVEGINAVARLQERFACLKVIFITAQAELSTEIFRVNPSNFLLKPIDDEKLLDAIERAVKQTKEEEEECFLVTFKGAVFKIRFRDILYFESEKRTVILHGRKESWTIYRKLDEVQEQVPDYFVRCHQSYLVNLRQVESLKPLCMELIQGDTVPVSRPKYKDTKVRFMEYWGQPEQEQD